MIFTHQIAKLYFDVILRRTARNRENHVVIEFHGAGINIVIRRITAYSLADSLGKPLPDHLVKQKYNEGMFIVGLINIFALG